jgi:hypothetical protein
MTKKPSPSLSSKTRGISKDFVPLKESIESIIKTESETDLDPYRVFPVKKKTPKKPIWGLRTKKYFGQRHLTCLLLHLVQLNLLRTNHGRR